MASGIIGQTIHYDYEAPLVQNYSFDPSGTEVYIFLSHPPELICKMARRNDDLRKRIFVLNMEQLSVKYYLNLLKPSSRQGS